jgi:transcriptional regulator with XRE-family HTH domain
MKHQGKVIESLVSARRISVSTVARRIGVNRVYVYDLFKKDSISSEIIWKVSQVFGVSPAVFFTDEKPSGVTVVVVSGELEDGDLNINPARMLVNTYIPGS